MERILFLFLTTSLLICCEDSNKDTPRPPSNPKSYIQGFFELNDIHVFPMSGYKVNKENNSINLTNGSFDAPRVYEITDGVGIFVGIGSDGVGKGLISWTQIGSYTYYQELTEKIGDVSYNSNLMFGLAPGGIIAVADTIQSVNITCDKQIDEAHPAGSSLNDIFSIYFEDPYAVIKVGYKTPTSANHYSLEGRVDKPKEFPYSLFGAKLSSVDFSKKLHMGTRWGLVLDTAPENTGEYIFTVSITNKQGTKQEKTANPIQLKGLK